MRTLYLCRHAKSSWADPGQDDLDRPLNERGLRNAPFMARLFKERGEPLDLMVTSTAARALATARFFAQELGAKETPAFDPAAPRPQLLLDANLYHASIRTILGVVNGLPDATSHVMLFGHNPGFTDAVVYFGNEDLDNLPTCGIVRIDFPIDSWKLAARDLGMLIWRDHPKRHPGQG